MLQKRDWKCMNKKATHEELSDLLHGRSTPRKLPSKPVRHSEVKIESSGCNPYAQPFIPKDTTRGQPASNKTPEDGITALATALAESINISRLPVPEPAVFNGDPIKYKDWKMSFQLLIERKNIPVAEKIYYLQKYVGGPARKAVESYFLLGTEMAYRTAWNTLEERYGSPFVIAKAFRDKLSAWPRIGTKDNVELRAFSDFLKGCEVAMLQIKNLQILNDCYENQRMLSKLPDWLTARWNRKVVEIEDQCGSFPTFSHFVNFVEKEARIACNPVTSLSALKANDSEKEKAKTPMTRNVGARTLTCSTEEKTDTLKCEFCERSNHNILTCRKFIEKENAAKVQFVKDKGLCFGCLKSGHISKKCEKRSICNTCKGKHPTCLHEERDKESRKNKDIQRETKGTSESKETKQTKEPSQETPNEAISNRVIQSNNTDLTSTIVPVWLSTKSNPEKELLLYALLDSQSDTTFVLQEKADVLDTDKKDVQLKLSTLSSKDTVVSSQKLTDLQVRGFYSSKRIPLPMTYTREFIPANLRHIPTPNAARAWSHLEHLADEIAPLIECDVGLLIGYNCSQALVPREVVSGRDNEPFAQKTDLGWTIVGGLDPCVDYGDAIGCSHRIVVKEVTPNSPSDQLLKEVHYICRTQVKEVITPLDVIKVLESDFNERKVEDSHFSQEDLRFISIMERVVKMQEDGHCELPLPFKKDRPNLQNNKKCAEHRLKCLKKRFERDKPYHKDYMKFMNETIERGDAEKVPPEELDKGPAWYIPHHGVYHPQKPGKIRVVFDCSVKYEGVLLNDYLLTGPELTNKLVGVLCKFRCGPGAIHCSIVFAKSRVAPIKVTTVPRLEQSAAVVAVRTSDMLNAELELNVEEFFWTDSQVVLGYVNNEARRFHVFVANRIQRIRENTIPTQWKYVASEDNPADHALRGLKAKDLIASNWFSGPSLLWQEELPSGECKVGELDARDSEVRKAAVHRTLKVVSLEERFEKFFSWSRFVKAIARLTRFVKEDLYLRKRWRRVQYLANEFWRRWRKEYLLNLQQRQKWQKTRRNAKVNDKVLIQDDTAPRNDWKLAKVTAVCPNEDGCVRKVQLLISDSTLDDHGTRLNKQTHLDRPIHKTVTLLEAE
ncbi:uncharacterized protein [Nerophis lumbriciformis]|uniref:uncharacterized protein n=1 Tax=Nerophis lumbriciformis TaxID=546530 RepID=UPI002ADFBADE|nr:uncharacterized protein LOC133582913 [Nerophis lumbriciformis]